MIKLPKGYIIIPVRCKTEEYSEIENHIETGVIQKSAKTEQQLEDATELRPSRLNTDLISGYYSKGTDYDTTLIELATGITITAQIPIEELDRLIKEIQPNIWNLWGILL